MALTGRMSRKVKLQCQTCKYRHDPNSKNPSPCKFQPNIRNGICMNKKERGHR